MFLLLGIFFTKCWKIFHFCTVYEIIEKNIICLNKVPITINSHDMKYKFCKIAKYNARQATFFGVHRFPKRVSYKNCLQLVIIIHFVRYATKLLSVNKPYIEQDLASKKTLSVWHKFRWSSIEKSCSFPWIPFSYRQK